MKTELKMKVCGCGCVEDMIAAACKIVQAEAEDADKCAIWHEHVAQMAAQIRTNVFLFAAFDKGMQEQNAVAMTSGFTATVQQVVVETLLSQRDYITKKTEFLVAVQKNTERKVEGEKAN